MKELRKTCYEKSAENIQKDVEKMILDGKQSLCLIENIELDNNKIWDDIECIMECLRKAIAEQYKSDYYFEKWIDLWQKIFPKSFDF